MAKVNKKALDRFNLSHAQFVILAILLWLDSTNQDITQILIVKLSKLDKMTVSKSLKKLASLCIIKRSEHEADTRVKKNILTKKGKEVALKIVPIFENIDNNFFGRLQKSNQINLIEIMKNLMELQGG